MYALAVLEPERFYRALADAQRLRILNLLGEGPLCVCFLQEILAEGQVKMSKQLAYLKRAGLVEAHREGTWMIYRLRDPVPELLRANLSGWREAVRLGAQLARDLEARERIVTRLREADGPAPSGVVAGCCGTATDEGAGSVDAEREPAEVGRSEDPWNDFPL